MTAYTITINKQNKTSNPQIICIIGCLHVARLDFNNHKSNDNDVNNTNKHNDNYINSNNNKIYVDRGDTIN